MDSINTKRNTKLLPLLVVLSGLLAVCIAQSPHEFQLAASSSNWCVARHNYDNLGPWHAPAHMWSCNSNEDQIVRFIPESKPENGLVVGRIEVGYRPNLPQLCLDIEGGVMTLGRSVRLWECNGTNAQRWALRIRVAGSYIVTAELQLIPQYHYFSQLYPIAKTYNCLATAEYPNTGVRIELGSCEIAPNIWNSWDMRLKGLGTVFSHTVSKFANLTMGTAQAISPTQSLLWMSSPTNPPPALPSVLLKSLLDPAKCIARNNDQNTRTAWSGIIHMWDCNIWAEDQNMRFLPSPSPRNGRFFGMLQLGTLPNANAQCLDVPGGWFDVGQIVRLWECNGSDAQLFSLDLTLVGNERRFKVSPISRPDLCMTISGSYTAPVSIPNGAGLILERCDAFANTASPTTRADWSMLVQGAGSEYLQVVSRMSQFSWAAQPLNDTHSLSWDLRCSSDLSSCPAPIQPPPPPIREGVGGGGRRSVKPSNSECESHDCSEL